MRFWLALTAFVAGLTLTAVGLVDQYENRPLEFIRVSKQLENPANYLMIPNRTLSSYQGSIQVNATGTDKIFIATVRESDVQAWLEPSPHFELRLSVEVATKTADLAVVEKSGTGNFIDPRGQDIWRTVVLADGSATIDVPQGNEVAVFIASTGTDPAPANVAISWDLPPTPLPFSPLPPIGLVVMSVGAIAVLYESIRRHRRSKITRSYRGPKPPKPRRFKPLVFANPKATSERRAARGLGFVALALSVGMVTGCAQPYANPIINPSPSSAPDTLTPVMTREQVERVLGEIVSVIADADSDLDREVIATRMTGPALAMRRAAYNLARRTEADDKPEPILAGPLKLFLPSATDTWPRSVMVVTGDERLQLMVLRQDSARDNYQLLHYSALLPGSDFPEVAAEEVGANAIKIDSRFLAFDPTELPRALGDLINSPEDNAWGGLIDPENKYVTDLIGVQKNLVDTLSNANLEFKHNLGDERISLLATADGGALAAIHMVDTYTIIPKRPGDAVAVTGDEALLLGIRGSATGIETRYGAMLLFYIPASGSEQKVRLLGATQQLLTAVVLGAQ
jgi:hypothetical protein